MSSTDIAGFVKERVVGRTVLASSTTLLPAAEACNVTTAIPTGSHELYVKKGINSNYFTKFKVSYFSSDQNTSKDI